MQRKNQTSERGKAKKCQLLPLKELLNWISDWLVTFQQETTNTINILIDAPKRLHRKLLKTPLEQFHPSLG
jgi:hypothetical protein